MASTHYLVEDPRGETSEVLTWFRGLATPPQEVATAWGLWLQFGPLVYDAKGAPDVEQSPLIAFFPARELRGVLWTVTEVHFRAKGSSSGGRALAGVQRAFKKWLSSHKIVFQQLPYPAGAFEYYLEGGIQNIAPVIHGLPSGILALERGQYFVADGVSDYALDRLCRTLSLRGVDCTSLS